MISTVRAIVDLIPLYIHFSKMSKNMIKVRVLLKIDFLKSKLIFLSEFPDFFL